MIINIICIWPLKTKLTKQLYVVFLYLVWVRSAANSRSKVKIKDVHEFTVIFNIIESILNTTLIKQLYFLV